MNHPFAKSANGWFILCVANGRSIFRCGIRLSTVQTMSWESSSKLKNSWDSLIRRAEHLAAKNDATNELLNFYAGLLRVQKEIYEFLRTRKGWLPSGMLEEDLPFVRVVLPGLLRAVEASGPAALVEEARMLLRADVEEIDRLLLEQWRAPSDVQFFAKAFLQPYARWLAESGGRPFDRDFERRENRCPFCGGRPQVGILRVRDASAESGGGGLPFGEGPAPRALPPPRLAAGGGGGAPPLRGFFTP